MISNGKTMSVLAMALSCMAAQPGHAADGELWETRGTMKAKAFGSMDLGVSRECQPLNWRENPEFNAPGADTECKAKKIERSASGYQWKFDCGATRGAGSSKLMGRDRIESEMEMDTPDGHFSMKLESRKVGSCNTAAQG